MPLLVVTQLCFRENDATGHPSASTLPLLCDFRDAVGVAHQCFHQKGIPAQCAQLDVGILRSQQIPRHPPQRIQCSICRSSQVRTKTVHFQLRVSSVQHVIHYMSAPTQDRYTLVSSSVRTGVASIVALCVGTLGVGLGVRSRQPQLICH